MLGMGSFFIEFLSILRDVLLCSLMRTKGEYMVYDETAIMDLHG